MSHRAKGFTLIELLVVTLIIGLLVNVVVFGMGRILKQTSGATVDQFQAWLADVEVNAALLGKDLGIRLEPHRLVVVSQVGGEWVTKSRPAPFTAEDSVEFRFVANSSQALSTPIARVFSSGGTEFFGNLSLHDGEQSIVLP